MTTGYKKIRLSTCFNHTVEVPDGSTDDVSLQEAKDAIEKMLPDRLDNEGFPECRITGVCNITSEAL